MERLRISKVLETAPSSKKITVCGWVRTYRNDRFLAINDGSTIHNIQLVVQREDFDESLLKQLNAGAAIRAVGVLVESQGGGQSVEIQVEGLEILGGADPDEFPIQMKKHSLEFLREKAHLRFRTKTFSAVFRIRHLLQFAVHKFFHDQGFYQLHTPIITGSDAEGAGEMFKVTTLDLENLPKLEDGSIHTEVSIGKFFIKQ